MLFTTGSIGTNLFVMSYLSFLAFGGPVGARFRRSPLRSRSLSGPDAEIYAAPEEAFRYFPTDINMWWPVATQSVVAYASDFKHTPAAVIFEPRVGGHIFERALSGEEHVWGTVLTWGPPSQVVFSFHPGR